LGIAAAILSVPENSTLVIEEIDNGIHPSSQIIT
jgi:AAA15 family ATPase/GTPase